MPLFGTKYMYIGKTNEDHTLGEYYLVTETGMHWFRKLGMCVWVTTNEVPNTTDPDYCMSCSPGYFSGNFTKM